MKAARLAGLDKALVDDKAVPTAKGGEPQRAASALRAAREFEIVRNLAIGSGAGLGELLIYGAPVNQAETSS